jgi:glutamate racemase
MYRIPSDPKKTPQFGAAVSRRPIGVFDSGVGGLSIIKVIQQYLPNEDIIYIADQAFAPYGGQTEETITQRSQYLVNSLIEKNCKAIVIACNTATAVSIAHLRATASIPIIGIEPGIKPAAIRSKTGVIGILATPQTLKSTAFLDLKERFTESVNIELQACPRFVELIEKGVFHGDEVKSAVSDYVAPLLEKGVDQIVLGCTHYSFLTNEISRLSQSKAAIIDTAHAVVVELERVLEKRWLLSASVKQNTLYFTSGKPCESSKVMSQLLGVHIKVSALS